MIIKIFDQGKNQGDFIIKYLLSQEKHLGFDPNVLSGNPDLTRNIINSLSFKNKYVAGCLSFRLGEEITKAQQYELMERFEKTFCPFSDQARVNFLWVEHRDKGGRLELNFLVPRIDLRSKKSFNLHPPGKANLLFFESFVRIENLRYGFEQVDKKEMTSQDARFYSDLLVDLYTKRKEYLINKYDRPKTIKRKGSNYGRGTKKFTGKYSQFRNCSNVLQCKAYTSRKFQQSNVSASNGNDGNRSRNNEEIRPSESISRTVEDYSKHTINAAKVSDGLAKIRSQLAGFKPIQASMSIDDELYHLGVQLTTCSPSEAPAIQARIDYLKGIQSGGGGNGGAGSIGGGMGGMKPSKPKL